MIVVVLIEIVVAIETIAVGRWVTPTPPFAIAFVNLTDDPKIVLSMLQIVLRCDPIPCGIRVTRKGEILLVYLIRIAADANIRTIAIKGLVAQRNVLPTAITSAA